MGMSKQLRPMPGGQASNHQYITARARAEQLHANMNKHLLFVEQTARERRMGSYRCSTKKGKLELDERII